MRFLGRSPRKTATPYVLRPPYGEARTALLARRTPVRADSDSDEPPISIVVDVGLEADVVGVYLLADGTISIYTTAGIHSTGLRGAPRVVEAAAAIRDEVAGSVGQLARVQDIAAQPLPERGHAQLLVRTGDADFAAGDRDGPGHGRVAEVAGMALLLTELARAALIEGFDRVEAGETTYRIAPEFRRIRSTLLDWAPGPGQVAAGARVAGVAVEIGDATTGTVTSLFALADGSTGVYRSDGTLAQSLGSRPGVGEAARALLDAVEAALPAFGPARLIPLPQPGRVQFVARARLGGDAEWTELVANAATVALADGTHPLAAAFARAREVLRIAG